jgi:hypothetical protein
MQFVFKNALKQVQIVLGYVFFAFKGLYSPNIDQNASLAVNFLGNFSGVSPIPFSNVNENNSLREPYLALNQRTPTLP